MDTSPPATPLLIACDDAATLEAALDLLDNCNEPSTSHSEDDDLDETLNNLAELLDHVDVPNTEVGSTHEPTIPRNAVGVSTKGKRRRTTPKQEIGQLRAQERELAVKLENLRLQAYDQKRRGRAGMSGNRLPFWKRIASRQYQSRLDSERENRRLRSLLTLHIGRAKDLNLAWKKQLAAEGYRKEINAKEQLSDEPLVPDNPQVMEELTQQADAIYSALEAFEGNVDQRPKSEVVFLEHSDSYLLPFESMAVNRATWHALASRFRDYERQAHVTEDTITCYAARNFRMGNANVRLRIRWVGRKYREADRTVIITQALLEPLHPTVPATFSFRETQVSIISPCQLPSEPVEADGAVARSRVGTLARVTGNGPDWGNGDGMRNWMESADGIAIHNVWRDVFQLRKNAIEDQIFEETRAY